MNLISIKGGLPMLPRIILSLAVLASFTTGPLAGELQGNSDAQVAPTAATSELSWTGFYVGGNIGGAWNRYEPVDQEPSLPNTSFGTHTAKGLSGGAQFGGDYQFKNWVFGARVTFALADVTGSHPNPLNPIQSVSNTISWLATGTVRLGYIVLPAALLYAKAGVGFIRESNLLSAVIGNVSVHTETPELTLSGWTAGLGLECLLARRWSVFAEYAYIGPGIKRATYKRNTDGQTFPFDIHNSVQEFRLGINYRFGGRVHARIR